MQTQNETRTEVRTGFIVLSISTLKNIVETMERKHDSAVVLDAIISEVTVASKPSLHVDITKSWLEYTKNTPLSGEK